MRQNNKRKLLGYYMLMHVSKRHKNGVPLARLIRENELNISTPHLAKLVQFFFELRDTKLPKEYRKGINDYIYPEWLILGADIQIQPRGWKYIGKVPWGNWERA